MTTLTILTKDGDTMFPFDNGHGTVYTATLHDPDSHFSRLCTLRGDVAVEIRPSTTGLKENDLLSYPADRVVTI